MNLASVFSCSKHAWLGIALLVASCGRTEMNQGAGPAPAAPIVPAATDGPSPLGGSVDGAAPDGPGPDRAAIDTLPVDRFSDTRPTDRPLEIPDARLASDLPGPGRSPSTEAPPEIPDAARDLVSPDHSPFADTLPGQTDGHPRAEPVGYWPFDEGAGSTTADLSGNGNPGAIFGATWTAGAKAGALSFDGSSDWVSVVDGNHDLDFGVGDFTLCAWIRTTAPERPYDTGRYDVLAKGDPYNTGISLSVTNTRAASYVGATGRQGSSASVPVVNDGKWHHLASRRTAGWVEIFVDGVSFHRYFAPDNVNVADPLIIGRHGTKAECYFNGSIDDVKLFARALSADELVSEATR